jgi:hypothetical protein
MTFRSRAMLNLSKGETCVRCGIQLPSVIPAHYTGVRRGAYGGGMGIKVHDFAKRPRRIRPVPLLRRHRSLELRTSTCRLAR